MKLVIAEKPSVARSIAEVLRADQSEDGCLTGNGYIVSWCIGHLVGLCESDVYDEKYKKWRYEHLPILPHPWQHKVLPNTKGQYQILKKLLLSDKVEEVICATDAGREGELIFRLVYEQAGCRKPIKRLWISSMENSAIADGFQNLKDGSEYDNLYASALCRSKADWLVGINGTRLFTVLYNHKLPVGRVQTPTLAMLVERECQISNFIKEPYYMVHIQQNNLDAVSERFTNRADAEHLQRACQNGQALVRSVEKEKKSSAAPKLYDLTTLQREANRLYGYTAQQTLDYAQALYEKKLITYPRTDSRFLTEDMEQTAREIIKEVKECVPFAREIQYAPDIRKVMDNQKVTDHHAIVPTMQLGSADLKGLPATEQKLLCLIAHKLLAATAAKMEYETTKIIIGCCDAEFEATGKAISEPGYSAIEKQFKQSLRVQQEEKKERILPVLQQGQVLQGVQSMVSEHFTSPPKHYTEDSLLSAMERAGNEDMGDEVERKGLGTPATRAAIIEKLIAAGLAERKNKSILPTPDGGKLITILPETVKSAKLTAEWEMQLTEIAKGNQEPEVFTQGIERMVAELVSTYHEVGEEAGKQFEKEKQVLGNCPRCGAGVIEIKSGYVCEGGRDCGFGLWKKNRFFQTAKKELTPEIVKGLLTNQKVKVSGLYSAKSGKRYTAYLSLEDTGEFVNFKVEFPKKRK